MSINSVLDGLRDRRLEVIQDKDVKDYIFKVTYSCDKGFRCEQDKYLCRQHRDDDGS